jgi:signal transduction histidine kinase
MTDPKELKFRPYARLLTMLGDQLIKNERIALIEIIKNSYDADASWVKVSFIGFTNDYRCTENSKIVIEDDGIGMTRDIIEKHWVNPATPLKKIGKKTLARTVKKRVIQGEKGIGRFSLFKLGKTINITTRPTNADVEYILNIDLSSYDEDFSDNNESALFLDELALSLDSTITPVAIVEESVLLGSREITRAPHGTRIEITNLNGDWNENKVDQIISDLERLQAVFDQSEDSSEDQENSFEVLIYNGDLHRSTTNSYREKLTSLIENNSVFKIMEGFYDERLSELRFKLNSAPMSISIFSPKITGIKEVREYINDRGISVDNPTTCGSFSFEFYVFDFSNSASGRFQLNSDDKALIKQHRIYLYRDGIRVNPYGDPDDDWLRIDVTRGTVRASAFLSNDQVVGYVHITQRGNKELRDKTNREGLIDQGNATSDFIFVLRTILAWIRKGPYQEYQYKVATKHDADIFRKQQVKAALDEAIQATTDPSAKKSIAAAVKLYDAERSYLVHRAETTEHLAGVGLSVETASHDLMAAMGQSLATIDGLIRETQRPGVLSKEIMFRDLTGLRGILSFIEAQIKDIQLLFRSTKQKRKLIRISEVLDKVLRLYKNTLDKERIDVIIDKTTTPLLAKTTDAVLLQLFLNLFDNSIYWLKLQDKEKVVHILLDGDDGKLIFCDNGPGVSAEDSPYIFEPFFTGKGQDGRGLGLYIARQLLEKHGYSIALADLDADKPLSGASFVVSFVKEEE